MDNDDDPRCWDAFGPDSFADPESDGGSASSASSSASEDDAAAPPPVADSERSAASASASAHPERHLRRAVDAAALHLIRSFLSPSHGGGTDGVPISYRYLALPPPPSSSSVEGRWRDLMSDRASGRGIRIVTTDDGDDDPVCDAAAIFAGDEAGGISSSSYSSMRRGLVPGGVALVFFVVSPPPASAAETGDVADGRRSSPTPTSAADLLADRWKGTPFLDSVWDLERSVIVHSDNNGLVVVVGVIKRPCPVNASSCPWKDASRRSVPSPLASYDGETWIEYERRVCGDATVPLTAAERLGRYRGEDEDGGGDGGGDGWVMTEASIRNAVSALRRHGFVVVRDLLEPSLTCRWGDAALSDFEMAANILKRRDGVDLLNPGAGSDPPSYAELAMREDLRLDLRDGPEMAKLRGEADASELPRMVGAPSTDRDGGGTARFGPVATTAPGVPGSLRFRPSVLEIVRRALNPLSVDGDASFAEPGARASPPSPGTDLYRGNFGRHNFSGSGPDGSPQPLRVGTVGSILSLPGCADQAVHADTPHLFEHLDCLPCHYCNLFTPGSDVGGEVDGDGCCTGNCDVGGTAVVDGSHRLSVSARLTAPSAPSDGGAPSPSANGSATPTSSAAAARDEMHLRTIRPSLRPGDVMLFDCRILHFGLANRSSSSCPRPNGGGARGNDGGGAERGVGGAVGGRRRPMLYVNMTHAWFHDPKNWDERESVF